MLQGRPRRKIYLRPLLVFLPAAVVIGCGSGRTVSPPVADPPNQIPIVAHVFLLIEENHAYCSVIGNPVMPYTNQLAQQYALATQYYANVHNSLPNYFMLTVGNLIASNDLYTGVVTVDNVARAVTVGGKSWRVYAESLPSVGYLGPSVIPYARDHNPFTYFSDVQASAAQAANLVPFTQLATDLQNNTLADYSLIIPNLANDGHDCPNEASYCTDTQKLANIDSWIQTNLGPLMASTVFQNSLLIYTWDESDITDVANGGGHVATILISPKVRRGYQSTTLYQHQSTLRLTMQLLGISDYPGAAATAPDMTEFF
jgi:phosphatidylinositol-3-phosphatase